MFYICVCVSLAFTRIYMQVFIGNSYINVIGLMYRVYGYNKIEFD